MLFNSIQFLLFFPLVCLIYFLLPHKFRWMRLLGASYYFYMNWEPIYALLIFGSTLTTYVCGILIEKYRHENKKWGGYDKAKISLVVCLIINLGILFSFKYFNFINESVFSALEYLGIRWYIPNFDILLPVGISFYTFQAIGYSIDVYRGAIKAERHFGIYALFVSYFPQLVAGPIERAKNLLGQLREKHTFNPDRAVEGLKLMLWGFFMKLVVADRLSLVVNSIYNNVDHHNGTMLIYGTILFAFQIYCDFAGYSNIAIGASKIMGIDLMVNFRRPYFATSIKDFWSRWHISLSTWFKDYVYIPLGGNRVNYSRHLINLFITFVVSGIWHGANWTFVLWGVLHGTFIIVNHLKLRFIGEFSGTNIFVRIFNIVCCFVLVSFAWIFFRANSVTEAFLIIEKMFTDLGAFESLGGVHYQIIAMLVLMTKEFFDEFYPQKRMFMDSNNIIIRYITYVTLIFIIILIGVFDNSQFIYFQF